MGREEEGEGSSAETSPSNLLVRKDNDSGIDSIDAGLLEGTAEELSKVFDTVEDAMATGFQSLVSFVHDTPTNYWPPTKNLALEVEDPSRPEPELSAGSTALER